MTGKDRKARDERVRLRRIIETQRKTIMALTGTNEALRCQLAEAKRREESALDQAELWERAHAQVCNALKPGEKS